MHLQDSDLIRALIHYLHQTYQLKHIGVLNDGNRNEDIFTNYIQNIAADHFHMTTEVIRLNDADGNFKLYRDALQKLRDYGYRTIVSYLKSGDRPGFEAFVRATEELHMNTKEFLFVFPQVESLHLLQLANLTKQQKTFLDGTLFVSPLDSFHTTVNQNQNDTTSTTNTADNNNNNNNNEQPQITINNNDPFFQAWKNLDIYGITAEQRQQQQQQQQQQEDSTNNTTNDDSSSLSSLPYSITQQQKQELDEFRRTQLPWLGSGVVYDSVMAMGIAACRLQQALQQGKTVVPNVNHNNEQSSQTPPPPLPPQSESIPLGDENLGGGPNFPAPTTLPQNTLISFISNLKFQGASGVVDIPSSSQIRQPKGINIGILNAQLMNPGTLSIEEDTLRLVITSTNDGTGPWKSTGSPFSYTGGTTTAPSFDLVVKNHNYLSTWVRVVGLSLYGFVVLFSVVIFFYAVLLWRKKRVRRANNINSTRVVYSMLLCVSCSFMAHTILALSFDENVVDNVSVLDRNCQAAPWFLFVGLVTTYTILFFKLWNLENVFTADSDEEMEPSRMKTLSNAFKLLWPFPMMLLSTIIIMSSWTIIDPWHWDRTFVSMTPPETYGQCGSRHVLAWSTPLAAMLAVSVVVAFGLAWKTVEIASGNSSGMVFYAICVQIQAWFVFLPVIMSLDGTSSSDAIYLGRVLWVWIVSASPLIVISGPEILYSKGRRRTRSMRTMGVSGGIHYSRQLRSSIKLIQQTSSFNMLKNIFINDELTAIQTGRRKNVDSQEEEETENQQQQQPPDQLIETLQ